MRFWVGPRIFYDDGSHRALVGLGQPLPHWRVGGGGWVVW